MCGWVGADDEGDNNAFLLRASTLGSVTSLKIMTSAEQISTHLR